MTEENPTNPISKETMGIINRIVKENNENNGMVHFPLVVELANSLDKNSSDHTINKETAKIIDKISAEVHGNNGMVHSQLIVQLVDSLNPNDKNPAIKPATKQENVEKDKEINGKAEEAKGIGFGAGYNGGEEQKQVRKIQKDLQDLDYDIGKYGADGKFGLATEKAVTNFQKDHELPANGVVDEKTGENIANAANIARTIKRKEQIIEVQTDLQELGYDIGKYGADGKFGSMTKKAVTEFQKDHELPANGIVDDNTRKNLSDAANIARTGQNEEQIREVQRDLRELDYDIGKYGADGKLGPITKRAVKEFKEDHGLPRNGVVDEKTRKNLSDAVDTARAREFSPDRPLAFKPLERPEITPPFKPEGNNKQLKIEDIGILSQISSENLSSLAGIKQNNSSIMYSQGEFNIDNLESQTPKAEQNKEKKIERE